jgi:hypothetical protein
MYSIFLSLSFLMSFPQFLSGNPLLSELSGFPLNKPAYRQAGRGNERYIPYKHKKRETKVSLNHG